MGHSIFDRKLKIPECGDHKNTPTEFIYFYSRDHTMDKITFLDGDMNIYYVCVIYVKDSKVIKKLRC